MMDGQQDGNRRSRDTPGTLDHSPAAVAARLLAEAGPLPAHLLDVIRDAPRTAAGRTAA